MQAEKREELLTLGQKIYQLRKSRGLNQRQLADMLGIDFRQLSRYENGEAEMGALLYERVLKILGPEITPQTESFLQQWGTLSTEDRQQLLNLAVIMNKANGKT